MDVRRPRLADRILLLVLHVLQEREGDVGIEGQIEFAGDEAQHAGAAVRDDLEFDRIEIGAPLLPVVGIAHQLDHLVALEVDDLERAGADRLGAHHPRLDVTRIDRSIAGRQHRHERRLLALQRERHLVVAVGRDFLQVLVPDLTRVLADDLLLVVDTAEGVPRAFHVLGCERLPVMPLYAAAQLEGELRLVVVPRPALGELGHDLVGTVDLLLRIEEHEIVEDRHERHVHRDRRFLVDRGTRRIVTMRHTERPALLLREGRGGQDDGGREAAGNDCQAISHFLPPRGTLVGVFVLPRCPAGYHIM